jgi:SAM-dependent methyltransferase
VSSNRIDEPSIEQNKAGSARLKSWISRLAAKGADAILPQDDLPNSLSKLKKQLLLARKEDTESRRQIKALEGLLKHEMRQHRGLCLLPPPELRMNVGRVSDAANFWGQGLGSARRVIEVFGDDPGGLVLDWGCGSGRTFNWLNGHGAWSQNYRGCDVDRAAITWLFKQGVTRVKMCEDLPPLPYEPGEFVGLFCFSVLTHIHPQRHRAWYEDIHRVLKPGGRAYVTVTSDAAIMDRKTFTAADKAKYLDAGWYYSERSGHYKDAVAVSKAFSLDAVQGLFEVEAYRESGYHLMDDMILRKLV